NGSAFQYGDSGGPEAFRIQEFRRSPGLTARRGLPRGPVGGKLARVPNSSVLYSGPVPGAFRPAEFATAPRSGPHHPEVTHDGSSQPVPPAPVVHAA
ncbi:MAG: hypothetical protein ACK56I_22215, partial [bacterium]